MSEAVIVSVARTAVGKAKNGTLKDVRPDDLAAHVVKGVLDRAPGVKPEEIEDVILGCAMPEGEQGMNMARIAGLRAGLRVTVPGITINRFCASGLQAIGYAAERIQNGNAHAIIAGGAESMSMVPMGGNKFSANPTLAETMPDAYLSMGLTAERVAAQYNITRKEQDEFALQSFTRAKAAIAAGKFKDEILPFTVERTVLNEKNEQVKQSAVFDTDECALKDTSAEKLAGLKPAFAEGGTVTAGNSSQMSDGAAAVLVMSKERAAQLGLQPMAKVVAYAVAGVPPGLMGLGPVAAIPKALEMAHLKQEDIGLIELNEAFAGQSLGVMKELKLDADKVNVNGGAIALGHPLGCSGAKLSMSLIEEMQRRNVRYGMVTACVGGGMGAAAIFELCDKNLHQA